MTSRRMILAKRTQRGFRMPWTSMAISRSNFRSLLMPAKSRARFKSKTSSMLSFSIISSVLTKVRWIFTKRSSTWCSHSLMATMSVSSHTVRQGVVRLTPWEQMPALSHQKPPEASFQELLHKSFQDRKLMEFRFQWPSRRSTSIKWKTSLIPRIQRSNSIINTSLPKFKSNPSTRCSTSSKNQRAIGPSLPQLATKDLQDPIQFSRSSCQSPTKWQHFLWSTLLARRDLTRLRLKDRDWRKHRLSTKVSVL